MKHVVLILTSLLTAIPPNLRAAEAQPPLWAAYYAWYETGTGPHGRWRMWSDDKSTTPSRWSATAWPTPSELVSGTLPRPARRKER